jgi:hypothetical protein
LAKKGLVGGDLSEILGYVAITCLLGSDIDPFQGFPGAAVKVEIFDIAPAAVAKPLGCEQPAVQREFELEAHVDLAAPGRGASLRAASRLISTSRFLDFSSIWTMPLP